MLPRMRSAAGGQPLRQRQLGLWSRGALESASAARLAVGTTRPRPCGCRGRGLAAATGTLPLRGPASSSSRATPSTLRRGRALSTASQPEEDEISPELVRQVSRLVEDDPALAQEFAKCLSTDDAQKLEAICASQADSPDMTPLPTKQQLRQVCMASALPFFGFGVLDNAVMITFGDYIDKTLCVTFGFSTMAAAALGNTFSDGIGVYSGGVVEDAANRLGYEAPPLSRAQQGLDVTKRWERLGQLFGITVGCLVGMFPLFFFDQEKTQQLRRERLLDDMYHGLVEGACNMLGAKAAMIMLVDQEKQELHTRSVYVDEEQVSLGRPTTFSGLRQLSINCGIGRRSGDYSTEDKAASKFLDLRSKIGEGIMGDVAMTGQFLNIQDVRGLESQKYYNPERHDDYQKTGIAVRSVLCVPIFSYDETTGRSDKVVGVVEVINKKDGDGFTEKDEDALAALCMNISVSLAFEKGEENGFATTLEMCKQSLEKAGTRINDSANRRLQGLFYDVMCEMAQQMDVECVELRSVNLDSREVRTFASSAGISEEKVKSVYLREDTAMGQAERTGMTVIGYEQPRGPAECLTPVCCCPIYDCQCDLVGFVVAIRKLNKVGFTESDMDLLTRVSSPVAMSLEGTGSSTHRLLQNLQRNRAADSRAERVVVQAFAAKGELLFNLVGGDGAEELPLDKLRTFLEGRPEWLLMLGFASAEEVKTSLEVECKGINGTVRRKELVDWVGIRGNKGEAGSGGQTQLTTAIP